MILGMRVSGGDTITSMRALIVQQCCVAGYSPDIARITIYSRNKFSLSAESRSDVYFLQHGNLLRA